MTFPGCPIWVSMEGVVIGKIIFCSVAAVENYNLKSMGIQRMLTQTEQE